MKLKHDGSFVRNESAAVFAFVFGSLAAVHCAAGNADAEVWDEPETRAHEKD